MPPPTLLSLHLKPPTPHSPTQTARRWVVNAPQQPSTDVAATVRHGGPDEYDGEVPHQVPLDFPPVSSSGPTSNLTMKPKREADGPEARLSVPYVLVPGYHGHGAYVRR